MIVLENLSSGRLPKTALNREVLDYRELVPIDEGLSGITDFKSRYPVIGTMDVYDCIGGLGWFPDYELAFSFHVAHPFNIRWQNEEIAKGGNRSFLYPLFEKLEQKIWNRDPSAQAELHLFGGGSGLHSGFSCTTSENLIMLEKALAPYDRIEIKSALLAENVRAAAIDSRNGRISTTPHTRVREYIDYFSKAYSETLDGVRGYFGEGGIMPAEIQFDGTSREHRLSRHELLNRAYAVRS